MKKVDITPYQKQPPRSSIALTPRALGVLVVRAVAARPDIRVWWLRGPLGSGKTTAARAIAHRLGVRGVVASPTYTIRRAYPLTRQLWRRLVHIDAYRLRRPEEYEGIGVHEDLADEKTLTLVEWPEKFRGLRWPVVGVIAFEILPAGRRVTLRLPTAAALSALSRHRRPAVRRKSK